eukprot:CAMPEP_0170506192 /NCGR_PEP_ID=MMETSP0208-20121228/54000_1 /TAXON_ID=197538 /ORGANISM="Strombidium inclinatum, Strain S3" /LENGTH=57 /DNA_ID=CAMNT_0010787561 /DNA_START=382 /DNA_END=555 /DNA_ORIENTATION=-
MAIYKKIQVLLFIKTRIQKEAKKNVKSFEQQRKFEVKFQTVEECKEILVRETLALVR